MQNILLPDPENDPDEEAELTYRLQEAIHEYEGDGGPCEAWARKFCYTHNKVDDCAPCGAQKSSVLHYPDPEWHGWECYCRECSE
jgi:hypothetical protein